MSPDDLLIKRSSVDAIIAVHMFGNMCDMPKIIEAADGKPVIEDCAQAIGSKLNGKHAGTFGTAAIFSFRSGKYLSVGEGGAVYSASEEIISKVKKITNSLPKIDKKDEFLHVLKTYLRSKLRTRPLFGLIGQLIWRIYNKNAEFNSKTPVILGKMFSADLVNIKFRIRTLEKVISIQRRNAEIYSNTLNFNGKIIFSEKSNSYNRYLYPIKLPTESDRNKLSELLKKSKIGSIMPYQDSVEIGTNHFAYKGDCPITERIEKNIIVIPVHYNITRKIVQKIVKVTNEFYAQSS
jgi:dTDP-4-amino-4,6-dideoxygalactose transaminase